MTFKDRNVSITENDLKSNQSMYVSLYPPSHTLTKAISDLIVYYEWKYVTLLFENFENLYSTSLHGIEKTNVAKNEKVILCVRELGPDVKKWPMILKEIKLMSPFIIVDIQTKHLSKFFEIVII